MADIMPQGAAIDGDDDILIDTTDGAQAAADPAVPELSEGDAEPELPKGAVRQPDGSVVLAFAYPCAIKYRRRSDQATREETLEQLHLHRLTGADMRAVTAASQDKMIVVAIARSARISEQKMGLFYDRMDAADAAAAMEIVSAFLGNGRKTGR